MPWRYIGAGVLAVTLYAVIVSNLDMRGVIASQTQEIARLGRNISQVVHTVQEAEKARQRADKRLQDGIQKLQEVRAHDEDSARWLDQRIPAGVREALNQ